MTKLCLLAGVFSLCLIQNVNGQRVKNNDTTKWIESFREFRDAVYHNDRQKVKSFIDFQLMNENNEIWYLVYDDNEQQISKLAGSTKPLTEKDFAKNFDKIFDSKFINAILKIKTNELYKNKNFETTEFKEDSTTCKMFADFDNKTNMLMLNLSLNVVIKNEDGEIEDGGESSRIYEFQILKNGEIKFIQIRLAG